MQGVLRPQDEGQDPDLERPDYADAHDREEAPLRGRRQLDASQEQPEPKPAQQERQREEVRPANDVLRRRRARCAVGLGRRRGFYPDAEGEDARHDVAVLGEHMPAHRVGPAGQTLQRDLDDRAVGARLTGQRVAELVLDLDRVRLRLDGLVEVEDDRLCRRLQSLPVARRGGVEIRMGEGRSGKRKCRHKSHQDSRAKRRDKPAPRKMRSIFRGSHRCGLPAKGERCPNTGAVSRSEKRKTAVTTKTNARPVRSTTEPGLKARTSGTAAPIRNVQPIA